MKKQKAFISIFAIFFSAIIVSVLASLYILLVKQISIMSYDSNSSQAIFAADSAFECALYKEQNASTTKSVFLPANSGNLGNCISAGDLTWKQAPYISGTVANSIANFSFNTSQGSYCGIITVAKQTTENQTNHIMTVSGQSRDCTDNSGGRIVERLINFVY